jgi:ribonuclease HII
MITVCPCHSRGIEYENQQIMEELKDKKDFSKEDVDNLRKQVSDKENLILEWKEKHQELMDMFRANKEKLSGLERYVSDLPTHDDYSTKSHEISFLC